MGIRAGLNPLNSFQNEESTIQENHTDTLEIDISEKDTYDAMFDALVDLPAEKVISRAAHAAKMVARELGKFSKAKLDDLVESNPEAQFIAILTQSQSTQVSESQIMKRDKRMHENTNVIHSLDDSQDSERRHSVLHRDSSLKLLLEEYDRFHQVISFCFFSFIRIVIIPFLPLLFFRLQ